MILIVLLIGAALFLASLAVMVTLVNTWAQPYDSSTVALNRAQRRQLRRWRS